MRAYSKKDVNKKALKGARIAVLGYGSQGRAHALNLRDSGYDVVIGVRKGDSWKKAKKDKFKVKEPAKAAAGADLVSLLAPDLAQPAIYTEIEPVLKAGATLLFAHGFNVHFGQIRPRQDLDVVLIAPKGPGDLVRRQYEQGRGVPCLIAVYQDATGKATERALAYADGIGPNKRLVVPTGPDGRLQPATSLVDDAHRAGLLVHPWTFRSDRNFLAAEYVEDPAREYAQFFSLGVDGVFSDFPDAAHRARDHWSRR